MWKWNCQRGDTESGCIPTIINGYTEPQKWRDRKVQNSVGLPNSSKNTCKSDKKEGDSTYRVGEGIVKKETHCKKLFKENIKHLPP
jgi:hypothetical protein